MATSESAFCRPTMEPSHRPICRAPCACLGDSDKVSLMIVPVPGVGHTRPWAGRERGIWAVAQEFVNISMEHRPRTGATPVHCCAVQVCSLAHPYTVANRAVNWQIPSGKSPPGKSARAQDTGHTTTVQLNYASAEDSLERREERSLERHHVAESGRALADDS
jgi:hypothetical protein